MRITNLDKVRDGELVRVRATVCWEDCDQPDKEIFIATEAKFAEDILPNPHAFLVGALIPALHLGERRITMDSAICPQLQQGLSTAMGLMRHWSQGRMQPLRLEVDTQSKVSFADRYRRTAMFLSGGIDSLTSLRLNRLTYPRSHPLSVQDCLMVHGFDIGGVVARGAKYHVFQRAREHMASVAEDAGVELIPVYTNIRHLWDARELWLTYFFGAVLAATAHAFAPRLQQVNIAASYDIANLAPCGSHPMLDPQYASADMHIRHCDVELTRIDKLRIIADWPVAFDHFRVCLANVPDRLNCGRCEKCVRTMTGLAAIGALKYTRAFEENDIAPELFDTFKITIRHREPFYEELIEPLKAQGRQDLAALIEAKLVDRSNDA